MADNSKALDRIRKLINLAASTNLQEAERAAYQVCALIRKHGLDVCDPDEIDGVYKQLSAAEQQVRELEASNPTDDSDDDDDPIFHAAAALGRSFNRSASVAYQSAYTTSTPYVAPKPQSVYNTQPSNASMNPFAGIVPPKPVSSSQYSATATGKLDDPVLMPHGAKYASKCQTCSKRIEVGDEAWWIKTVGICCGRGCADRWVQAHLGRF